jgi:hypothetical protein
MGLGIGFAVEQPEIAAGMVPCIRFILHAYGFRHPRDKSLTGYVRHQIASCGTRRMFGVRVGREP